MDKTNPSTLLRTRGFSAIAAIIIAVLALAAIGGGVWYYKAKTKQISPAQNKVSQQSVAQSQDEIADWKTFSANGISVSFPKKFVTEDGKDDFVYNKKNEGTVIQNAEYFYFCDGAYMPPTGKVCSGPFYFFGIQLNDYVVSQSLLDSWGKEVAYSKQETVNGKQAWVLKMCASNGCSTSIKFNHPKGTLSVSFYNAFYKDTGKPLFINETAKKILDTLRF